MGQFYRRNQIDEQWFNLSEFFKITFHYAWGQYSNPADWGGFLSSTEFPNLRKWIRDECAGDVIAQSGSNSYGRKWIDLYFEYETDLMAFKLKWL